MRGLVPQRRSSFQSLVDSMSWNIGKAHGIGRDGQEYAWGGWRLASCMRREARPVGRGVDFLLKGATDSSPSSPSTLSIHLIQNLVPFHKKPAQYLATNPLPCQLSRIALRMAIESLASSFPCNCVRNQTKPLSVHVNT